MPLPSFFQRKAEVPKPAAMAEDAGPVQDARTRARRRLIGAVVLIAAGIVGFPLLFETTPRPMPVDVPIDLARKDLPPPPPRPVRVLPPVVELPPDAGNETPAAPPAGVAAPPDIRSALVNPPAEAGPSPSPTPTAGNAPASTSASASAGGMSVAASVAKSALPTAPATRVSAPAVKLAAPAAKASASVPRSVTPAPEAHPAEAAASTDAPAGRFVVQVGAYTDQGALREARQKVEKLGLKTYTQDIDTPSGKRTRLRVGPFSTHDQAEAAGVRLKAIGLPGNLLSL